MEYKNDYDFIERSQAILDQYEKIKQDLGANEFYDVTLLICISLGILCMLYEQYKDKLPTDLLPEVEKEWGILNANIKVCLSSNRKQDDRSIKNIIRHLRNALAHRHITAKTNNHKIVGLTLEDISAKKTSFKAEISIEELRQFILRASNLIK